MQSQCKLRLKLTTSKSTPKSRTRNPRQIENWWEISPYNIKTLSLFVSWCGLHFFITTFSIRGNLLAEVVKWWKFVQMINIKGEKLGTRVGCKGIKNKPKYNFVLKLAISLRDYLISSMNNLQKKPGKLRARTFSHPVIFPGSVCTRPTNNCDQPKLKLLYTDCH